MEQNTLLSKLSFELGIAKPAYQNRAEKTIYSFLHLPETSKNSFGLTLEEPDSTKIKIRVKESPPSVQIVHTPLGGEKAGTLRIQEKLYLFDKTDPIVTVPENDLTRETIILNMQDQALDQILLAGLLSPQQIIALVSYLHENQPNLFVVFDRYLMGIESMTKTPVPFKVVEMNDETTWGYLKDLSTQFS